MKHKGGLFLLALLTLLTLLHTAHALTEDLITGFVNEGNVTAGGKEFIFIISEQTDPNYVILEFDNTYLKADTGECEIKEEIELCVIEISFDRTDPKTRTRYYKADVTVTRDKAEVLVTMSITLSADRIYGTMDNSYKITSTFQNTGSFRADPVNFFSNVTDAFLIESFSPHCKYNAATRTIGWNGTIETGNIERCVFTLLPTRPGTFNLPGYLTYFDAAEEKTVEATPLVLDIRASSMDLLHSISSSAVGVSDYITLHANVTNVLANESPVVTLQMTIPPGLSFVNRSYPSDKEENVIYWKDSLERDSLANLSLTLKAHVSGSYTIPIVAIYNQIGIQKIVSAKAYVEVSVLPLEIIHTGPVSIVGAETLPINISIRSNHDQYYYKNIQALTSSTLPSFISAKRIFEKMDEKELTVLYDRISTPEVAIDTPYNITVKLIYETEYGESIVTTKTIPITITNRQALVQEAMQEGVSSAAQEALNQTAKASATQENPSLAHQVALSVAREFSFLTKQNSIVGVLALLALTILLLFYMRHKKNAAQSEPPL